MEEVEGPVIGVVVEEITLALFVNILLVLISLLALVATPFTLRLFEGKALIKLEATEGEGDRDRMFGKLKV